MKSFNCLTGALGAQRHDTTSKILFLGFYSCCCGSICISLAAGFEPRLIQNTEHRCFERTIPGERPWGIALGVLGGQGVLSPWNLITRNTEGAGLYGILYKMPGNEQDALYDGSTNYSGRRCGEHEGHTNDPTEYGMSWRLH